MSDGPKERWRAAAMGLGLACAVAAVILEARRYAPLVGWLWFASLVLPALAWRRPARAPLERGDVVAVLGLLAAFAPLYLFFVYWIPFQMNTDEIAISNYAKMITGPGWRPDLLGPCSYFNFPTWPFAALGRVGRWLGGVTLENLRLAHAACGLLIVVPAYALFRLSFTRASAVVATALLMVSHALVMISRLVLRNNLPTLNITLACFLLLRGMRRGSRFDLFAGGVVAGLGFYHYPPARAIFALWLAYLMVATLLRLLHRWDPGWGIGVGRGAAVSALGFALAVAPMVAASRRAPPDTYTRNQLLVFPEGREFQRAWYGLGTTRAAYLLNVRQGLAMFNRPIPDQAWMYANHKAGFVDPLTGGLLWLGLAAALLAILRRRGRDGHLLAVTIFLTLFALQCFVINQAPHYTRMLMILPSVIHLVMLALEGIAAALARIRRLALSPAVLVAALAVPIVHANLWILGDHAIRGFVEGQDVGGVARYIGARSGRPHYTFYLAASRRYPFYSYSWGEPEHGEERLLFSTARGQQVQLVAPERLLTSLGSPPFTVFLDLRLWQLNQGFLRARYPRLRAHEIKPDGSLLAVEVAY